MTAGQRAVLHALTDGPLTVHELRVRGHGNTRGKLRRLEDRELVRRLGDIPYHWELTHAGRQALEPTE